MVGLYFRGMNVVDVFIALWILSAAVRGYQIGFLRQALSLGGFILGLFLGSWISPSLASQASSSAGRLVIALMCTIGLAVLLASLGELLTARILRKVKLKLAHTLNAGLGVILSIVATLLLAWVLASVMNRLPLANLGITISESRILGMVNGIMPPAPTVIERFGRLISPHGFPRVFVDNEPIVDPAGPPADADVQAAAAKAQGSLVKIEGNACGGVSVGSGFVAAEGLVITNAHVIAGVRQPVVIHGSERYRAVPLLFDAKLDLAILRVNKLGAGALPLAHERVERGRSGAVLGYPGGGRLTIDPAVILGSRQALGRDIYDRDFATREIYEIQADIDPGNSGGPLVLPDGTVAGIMFGESVHDNGISYAISSLEAIDDLQQAIRDNAPVSTGPCVS